MLSLFFVSQRSTPKIYTLSLHDALPICTCLTALTTVKVEALPFLMMLSKTECLPSSLTIFCCTRLPSRTCPMSRRKRSEEHTSELQSRVDLVCRLLLEKKKRKHLQILLY